MRVFFLGVAAGLQLDGGRGNRSMLVHPSRETAGHADYYRWATQVKASWERLLGSAREDPDRENLLHEFEESYEDLQRTVPDLPRFESLAELLERSIRRTVTMEVNAARGRTPSPNWQSAYAHLLVGGQAMDRGFTVEGLTVTYMPRGIGVGNADTLQQRARFLGYKQGYIGYCRVYLEPNALVAYQEYVAHEEDLRQRIAEFAATGQPLSEWRRAFFLDGALEPTRRAVLDLDYARGRYSNSWFTPDAPHESADAVEANRAIVQQFLDRLVLHPDDGDPRRTAVQRHRMAEVALEVAYRELLTRFRVTRAEDSQELTGVLLQIGAYLNENPRALCRVYQISPNDVRHRSVDAENRILNLYQGAYPVHPVQDRGTIYRGDQAIRGPQGLTIQIHTLTVRPQNGAELPQVPTLAIWVPAEMARGWLVQEAPGS
jgi:hypothetical protein